MLNSIEDILDVEIDRKQKLSDDINSGKINSDKEIRCIEKVISDYYQKFLTDDQSHNGIEDFEEYLYLIDPTSNRFYYNYFLGNSIIKSFKRADEIQANEEILLKIMEITGKDEIPGFARKISKEIQYEITEDGITINFIPDMYYRDIKEFYKAMKTKALETSEIQNGYFNTIIVSIDPNNILSEENFIKKYFEDMSYNSKKN